jgi:hypothetical protein
MKPLSTVRGQEPQDFRRGWMRNSLSTCAAINIRRKFCTGIPHSFLTRFIHLNFHSSLNTIFISYFFTKPSFNNGYFCKCHFAQIIFVIQYINSRFSRASIPCFFNSFRSSCELRVPKAFNLHNWGSKLQHQWDLL